MVCATLSQNVQRSTTGACVRRDSSAVMTVFARRRRFVRRERHVNAPHFTRRRWRGHGTPVAQPGLHHAVTRRRAGGFAMDWLSWVFELPVLFFLVGDGDS